MTLPYNITVKLMNILTISTKSSIGKPFIVGKIKENSVKKVGPKDIIARLFI